MSDMKCPICGKDLVEIELGECWFLVCCNSKCRCKGVASDAVWEYIDRTRKALDVAVDALKRIKFRGEHSKYECCKVSGIIAQGALDKIKALEQKESAFVHNKIEFPEFNDNLLEEFDKQFFEDGQDDI